MPKFEPGADERGGRVLPLVFIPPSQIMVLEPSRFFRLLIFFSFNQFLPSTSFVAQIRQKQRIIIIPKKQEKRVGLKMSGGSAGLFRRESEWMGSRQFNVHFCLLSSGSIQHNLFWPKILLNF